jgi:plastocyanin
MGKKIVFIFMLFALLSVLFVACSGRGDTNNSANTGSTNTSNSSGYDSSNTYGNTGNAAATTTGSNEIHLTATNFAQPSITIAKGSKLTMIDDSSIVHQIQNGSWVNDQPKPLKESNAPTVNVAFNGNDTQTIGPFPVAGTYHLFCTIHDGMNLTVIVK